ncbi:hypothetical protein CB1_001815057 [Camelus ferus]|nr:hypothetical protein CB1_001815057 [Camelus ferus]
MRSAALCFSNSFLTISGGAGCSLTRTAGEASPLPATPRPWQLPVALGLLLRDPGLPCEGSCCCSSSLPAFVTEKSQLSGLLATRLQVPGEGHTTVRSLLTLTSAIHYVAVSSFSCLFTKDSKARARPQEYETVSPCSNFPVDVEKPMMGSFQLLSGSSLFLLSPSRCIHLALIVFNSRTELVLSVSFFSTELHM